MLCIAMISLALIPRIAQSGEPNRTRTTPPTLWAGHQFVAGKKPIPVLGKLKTRTDTWLLAEVHTTRDGFRLEQRVCKVDFASVLGVTVSFAQKDVIWDLPRATIAFRPGPRKLLVAQPWRVGWKRQDIDRDGHPGVRIRVDAPLCGGFLDVASDTLSVARGEKRGQVFVGQIGVRVKQHILGVSGKCLSLVSSDATEQMTGHFAYVPVPPGTTCNSLLKGRWPVKAPTKL